VTDPTWTIDEDGDPVWPPHVPSEEFELTGFYLTADPCCEEASAQIPEGAHADLIRCVRDAGLLPAALDVIARLDGGWEAVADEWVKFIGYCADADSPPNPNFHRQPIADAERAVLDLAKDRQP
jgi:hypothetical protein